MLRTIGEVNIVITYILRLVCQSEILVTISSYTITNVQSAIQSAMFLYEPYWFYTEKRRVEREWHYLF